MKTKNSIIKELIKNDIRKGNSVNNVYKNILNKLNLDSIYEDCIKLYKIEINNRMDLFFYGEVDKLDLYIDFDMFYKEVMKKEFKDRNDLSKKLQKAYDSTLNFSCLIFFNNYSYKRKLYNIYDVLDISELIKLKN